MKAASARAFRPSGVNSEKSLLEAFPVNARTSHFLLRSIHKDAWRAAAAFVLCLSCAFFAHAQNEAPKKYTWQPLQFAILRFNDEAPNSWNIYHCEKKGLLLVRLWKRYLFIDVQEEEVYDLDPQKLTNAGNNVTWSFADLPERPINTPDWTDRNVGRMQRLRFRLGKDGHFLELQLPFDINGRPIY